MITITEDMIHWKWNLQIENMTLSTQFGNYTTMNTHKKTISTTFIVDLSLVVVGSRLPTRG
jgi:hypothetical protein